VSPTTRTRLVQAVATGLYHGGLSRALAWAVAYTDRRPAFPILTYHRINDDDDPFFPAVPTAVFDRHMAHVARTYRVMTVEALVERMQRGGVPRNALAITFDDGYRDNLTHAAPILLRHGLPATIFLATGFVGSGEAPWFDRLALAFKLGTAGALEASWGDTLGLESTTARLRALDRTLAVAKTMPDDDRRRAVEEILEALGGPNESGFKNLMLSWDDVHALAGMGFSIGAHTVSHPILSRVSAQRARMEIVGSRTMIESACGVAPKAFAYPNGRPADYTGAIVQAVREAGFTCAVTTRGGVNTAATSPWELHRGGPWEHDLPTFAMKLAIYRRRQDLR
jgi:peptidoglycan/xylan/chitin deacetylase (PgdA/CDA1 family)